MAFKGAANAWECFESFLLLLLLCVIKAFDIKPTLLCFRYIEKRMKNYCFNGSWQGLDFFVYISF